LSKSKKQNSLGEPTKKIEKELRRALLGGQRIQVAKNTPKLAGGDIKVGDSSNLIGTVGDDSNVILGNNNKIIIYHGISEEQLTEILHALENQIARDKYARALQAYLKELSSYCNDLPYLTLYNIPSPLSLDRIYVPIKFLQKNAVEQKATKALSEILREGNKNILLMGEPGSGKSTILRQIAKYAWSEPSKIGLEEPHLPFVLPLRIFSKHHFSLQERIRQTLDSMGMLDSPLPPDFFQVWAENEQVRWLFLLDGLDEVPVDERIPLFKLINDLLSKDNCLVVITSRPTGYHTGELDEEKITNYVLQSFSSDQVKEFAKNWFAEKGEYFLQSLENMELRVLYESPLLLTIAAKVYFERGNENRAESLPERRSTLYEEFVDICLKEARLHGLSDDLGEDLAEDSRFGLAHLAWEMTKRPQLGSEDELAQVMTEYFKEFQDIPEDRARTLGRKFLHIMGRRSGIFVKEGNTYNWLHPTFREYLAGWHMVEKEIEKLDINDLDSRDVYYRFVYPELKEVTLFAVEILATRGRDITPWVNGFYKSRGPLEGGEALSTLGNVFPDLAAKIIDELLSLARRDWRGGKSVFLLGKLSRYYPQAKDALVNLVYDNDLADGFVHEEAITLLGKSGYADELLMLAQDAALNPYLRKDAIMELMKMAGETEKAARACLAVAQDKNLGKSEEVVPDLFIHLIKIDVANALQKLPGWDEEATATLLALAEEGKKFDSNIRNIVEILGKMGRVNEIKQIAQDTDFDIWGRASAVEEMLRIQLLQMDLLNPSLRDLVVHEERKLEDFFELIRDENEDLRARFWAILKFSPRDDHSFFSIADQSIFVVQSLAEKSEIDQSIRTVARELAPIYKQIIPAAMEFICNEEEDLDQRLNKTISLARSGRVKEIWQIIQNKQITPEIRTRAAGELVGIEPSLDTLWNYARNKEMAAEVRMMAVVKLFNDIWDLTPEQWHQIPELLSLSKSIVDNTDAEPLLVDYIKELPNKAVSFIKFANSKKIDLAERIQYAEMIAHFGYLDDSLQILISFIQDRELDDRTLEQTIAALGRIGDARCLPALEAVAKQNQDDELSTAINEAIENIHQRENNKE
jgi:hypothetical protein